METLTTDILILGGGGAGLFAALHAWQKDHRLGIVVAAKGLVGQSGCTRMVQGGFNAVLDPADSLEAHFLDTLKGGAWLNDQELAWALVSEAPKRIHELESIGCFFDRRPDGRIAQKPFAGQSFDRTVHKGDLTGIEVMARLKERLLGTSVTFLDEHRALDLLPAQDGGCGGALLL
ncbi:MAG: FAD-dependent oxidoreductase, partial [Dehalococcoidia bacterium]